MVDHNGSVIHLINPVNVTRISIAGIVDRVFKLKVSYCAFFSETNCSKFKQYLNLFDH